MPDSSITPGGATYENQSKYTVNDADCATIDLRLTLEVGSTPATFTLTYPSTAAPTGKLVQGASSMDLAVTPPPPAPPTYIEPGRHVTITQDTVGTDKRLTVIVETEAVAPALEPWTVRIRGLGNHQCVFNVEDGVISVARIMCDAHAALVAPPANPLELTPLPLAANPALVQGIGAVVLGTKVNFIGSPTPKTRYRWEYTGLVALGDLPDVTELAAKTVNLPGSTFQLSPVVTLKLRAWLTDNASPPTILSVPDTNEDLPADAAPAAFTISHRPQRLMVVLDRTGSMSANDKWKNATTAARIMTHLFTAIRKDNPNDKVGILEFDDANCFWHDDTKLSPTTKEVFPLTDVTSAWNNICGQNLGNPGGCTNIGDALFVSWNRLTESATGNPRYAAVLITDGIENAGYRRIFKGTDTGGVPVIDYIAPDDLVLSSIGIGSDVNHDALNAIAGTHVFHSVPAAGATDVKTLKDAATQSVAQLFGANGIPVTTAPAKGTGAVSVDARFFPVNAGEHRVAFAVETKTAGDTIDISYAKGAGSFEPAPAAALSIKTCQTHIFVVVDLDVIFPAPATVGETEWGILLKSGGINVTDLESRLLAWDDLRAQADHVFDKQAYRTGEPMTVTVRLRDGDQPISGARVSVTMKRPKRSIGDFLARNSGLVVRGDGEVVVGTTTHGGGRKSFGDTNAKFALYEAILQARGEADIGWEEPPGIFADGTNDLHEIPGTGNYTNVYTNTTKEGPVSFRFYVDGTLADGSVFSRLVLASKSIGVKIDPLLSDFTIVYGLAAPPGYQAVQVRFRPEDRFGNLLGPFRANELNFVATSGTWDGEVVSEPDGTYTRTLLYKDGVPVVSIQTQGTSTIPLPVSRGCLGWLLRPLLWLLALILRLLGRV